MFQRTRTAITAAAVVTLATGCFYVAFLAIANPGGSISIDGIVEDTDPLWETAMQDIYTCLGIANGFEGGSSANYDAHAIVNLTGANQRISIDVDWLGVAGLLALYTLEAPEPLMPFPGVEIPFVPVQPGALPDLPGPPFDPSNVEDCLEVAGFFTPGESINNQVMLAGEAFMIVLVGPTIAGSEAEGAYPYTVTVSTN